TRWCAAVGAVRLEPATDRESILDRSRLGKRVVDGKLLVAQDDLAPGGEPADELVLHRLEVSEVIRVGRVVEPVEGDADGLEVVADPQVIQMCQLGRVLTPGKIGEHTSELQSQSNL